MIIFPNAKINIGLFVTAKRADGYHEIETIFYPVRLHDALEFVTPSGLTDDELVVTGAIAGMDDPNSNLVIKAIRKVRELRRFPFLKVHLHKAIPSGAGLGGGSSDASCIIKSVCRHFNLGIPDEVIKQIAGMIGSDCPFFIDNVPAFAEGRGEKLSPAPPFLSGLYIALVNPGFHISTREAYANCTPSTPPARLNELIALPVDQWKNRVINDFEDYAFKKHPFIGNIKEELYKSGALFSLMTGSGSTVFGIFGEKPSLPDSMRTFLIYEGML